jgi:hypothetical protein
MEARDRQPKPGRRACPVAGLLRVHASIRYRADPRPAAQGGPKAARAATRGSQIHPLFPTDARGAKPHRGAPRLQRTP